MMRSKRWKIALLLAVPVGLYFVLAAQMSWRPRTIQTGWAIASVTFSPDGKSLAVSGHESYRIVEGPNYSLAGIGMAGVWDVDNRNRLQVMKTRCQAVIHIAFSPEGHKLAGTCGDSQGASIWEIPTGKLLREEDGGEPLKSLAWAYYDEQRVHSIDNARWFSPDGSIRCVINWSSVKLFDTKTGKLLRTLAGHTDRVTAIAFSPDGSTLATGSWDKTVMLWRIK